MNAYPACHPTPQHLIVQIFLIPRFVSELLLQTRHRPLPVPGRKGGNFFQNIFKGVDYVTNNIFVSIENILSSTQSTRALRSFAWMTEPGGDIPPRT